VRGGRGGGGGGGGGRVRKGGGCMCRGGVGWGRARAGGGNIATATARPRTRGRAAVTFNLRPPGRAGLPGCTRAEYAGELRSPGISATRAATRGAAQRLRM